MVHNDDSIEGDPEPNYEFFTNESISFNFEEGTNSKNRVFKYPGMDDNSLSNCSNTNNTIRKMYVVITNVQKPVTPAPAFLESEARMLLGAEKTYINGTVYFTNEIGETKSAIYFASAIAVALFSVLSVLSF